MDRAEAIKWYENEIRLLEAAPNLNGINGSCMEEEWKKQAEIHKLAIAALREQERKWISVEERLPEMQAEFIVTVKLKYDFEREYTIATDVAVYRMDECGDIDGCWETFNDWYEGQQYIHVTHWMPLPEPPKEGAEG
jgi:hypothetical protein